MVRTPSEYEAAAISAAIERFVAETAPASSDGQEEATGLWQRAALLEGVSSKDAFDPRGGERWLS